MSFDPGARIGAYKLLQSCGRGAYGEVFVAENLLTGERVALKVLFPSPKTLERELAGLIRCRDCRHANLVRIRHVERTRDSFYYTMELADDLNGGNGEYLPATLGNRLERLKRLPPEEVEKLADAIGGALRALHEKGLIHRDVKPDNILWINGVPMLGDAGLTAESRNNSLVGTPEFMPEAVLRKKRAALPADDFYALRLVLYCAFTGEAPREYPHCPPGLLGERTAALWKRILTPEETQEPDSRRRSIRAWYQASAVAALALAAVVFVLLSSRQTTARPEETALRPTAPENAEELLRNYQADEAEYEKVAAAAKRHRRIFYDNLVRERNRLFFRKEFAHLSTAEYLRKCGELRQRAAAGKERDVLLLLYECQDTLTRLTDHGAVRDLPPLLKRRHELLARLAGQPELAGEYGLTAPEWDFFDALTAEAPAYHWGEAMKNPKIREFGAGSEYRYSDFCKRLPGENLEELKSLLADPTVKLSDEEKLLTAVCAMHAQYIDQPSWERRDIRCDEWNIRLYAERFRQNKYLFERLYREYPQYRY